MSENYSNERNQTGRWQWPMTTLLLAVNVACFVFQCFAAYFTKWPINHYLALSPDGMLHGFVWQLLAFQFLHGGIFHLTLASFGVGMFHLLFNSVIIYCFGRAIEETLGSKTFLKIYFSSGVIGGLIQILVMVLVPHRFGDAVVGASAGAAGLIAAFATLFPERSLTLLLLFVFPIDMKAKVLLLLIGGFAVFGIIFPQSSIAHAAHLGGMLAGIAFVRWIVLPTRDLEESELSFSTKVQSPR